MNFNFKASDTEKHSAAHVLAAAVKRLYPNVKIGIGPVTKTGYFYDFDLPVKVNDEMLALIEKTANDIIKENLPFQQIVLDKNEAYNMLMQMGQVYKAELIQSIPDDHVSLYRLGNEFIDLCRGPHVNRTDELGIIKVVNVEKTHWKEDTSRPELQRIEGVVFQNSKEYEDFQNSQELSIKRDFENVAKTYNYLIKREGDNMFFSEEGLNIINSIEDFIASAMNLKRVSDLGSTQYKTMDDAIKHIDLAFDYKNQSYKNLPKTFRILSTMKNKISNKNVNFDALFYKTFVESSKIVLYSGEFLEFLIAIFKKITKGSFKVEIISDNVESPLVKTLSTQLEKNLISHDKVLKREPNAECHLVFKTFDTISKEWILATIYINSVSNHSVIDFENKNKQVGSVLSIFNVLNIFAFLIEEFGREIPSFFSPYHVTIIPIDKEYIEFAKSVEKLLLKNDLRVSIDLRSKSFKSKIKDAETNQVPFQLIIGNKEVQSNSVSVRHNGGEIGLIGLDNIVNTIVDEITR